MGDRVRLTALANVALLFAAAIGLVTIDENEPRGVIVDAAAATARTGTASFTIQMSQRTGDRPLAMTVTGRIDFEGKRFALTRETPRSDIVVADGVTYMKSEGAGPKPWLVLDNKPNSTAFPLDFGLVTNDPVAALDQLRRGGVARDVRADGTEDVRGVPTTRWVAHLDASTISAASGRNRELLESLGIKEIRYAVWVGGDGVLRRMSTVTEGGFMSASVSTELYDFGTAAPVEVPPPDQVRHIELPD